MEQFQKLSGILLTKDKLQNQFGYCKAKFQSFMYVKGLSGFGWDDELKQVCADDERWENLRKSFPEKKLHHWKGKSFPHFDCWEAIFQGRIATGKGASYSNKAVVQPIEPILFFCFPPVRRSRLVMLETSRTLAATSLSQPKNGRWNRSEAAPKCTYGQSARNHVVCN